MQVAMNLRPPLEVSRRLRSRRLRQFVAANCKIIAVTGERLYVGRLIHGLLNRRKNKIGHDCQADRSSGRAYKCTHCSSPSIGSFVRPLRRAAERAAALTAAVSTG